MMSWIAALLLPIAAQAFWVNKCGVYEAEGRLVEKAKGKFVLLLDQKSDSELELEIPPPDAETKKRVGWVMRAKFELTEGCSFKCKARTFTRLKYLEPYERAARFQVAGFKPKLEKPCAKKK